MKACKFCGTQVDNSEKRCPSCGSNVFLHICENCGQQFGSGFCPNCGVRAGAKKKLCPDCGSSYFTNACPNCGYTPSRKPVVQQVVHKHVYVRPEPTPPPTPTQARRAARPKKKGCGCLTWILILLVLAVIVSTQGGKKSSTGRTSSSRATATARLRATATVKPGPTATPDPEIAEAEAAILKYIAALEAEGGKFEPAKTDTLAALGISWNGGSTDCPVSVSKGSSLNNRGKTENRGTEPNYLGDIGYAVAGKNEKLENDDGRYAQTPWQIPVYRKDKQFWAQAGTVPHKTRVVVIDQELEPQTSRKTQYKGYLQVVRLDNGEACYLDVTNFVGNAYWELAPAEAAEHGYCIATFRQVSDYYPVRKKNVKCELEDGTQVLLPLASAVYAGSPDKENNPVHALVFREWTYGFGGVDVFFNPADLTITY